MSPSEPSVTWLTAFLDHPADGPHEEAVAFWRAVTGAGLSARRGPTGAFATLVPADGDPYLRVQRLDADPASAGCPDPRVHLDLHVADPGVATESAVRLGATVLARPGGPGGHVVLASPAGVVWCLVPDRDQRGAVVPTPPVSAAGRAQVDQVAVDVGPAAFDAELAFWQAVTGAERTPTSSPEFARLQLPGTALHLLLHRLDEDRSAGLHVDLSCDDRAAEVARHVRLGAEVVAQQRSWTVLRDPAGLVYCVTDRPVRERP
ncbi:VOC family protein [Nocardioides sp.]|uniref:VOC family protein n=1 Tax=Nocardioides sp. TaxID=35761 RepID=UPI0035114127